MSDITMSSEDIVVTQDYDLAEIALRNGAKAINHNGMIYKDEDVDRVLSERHTNQKARRGGGRVKGSSKRTKKEDDCFAAALTKLLEQ